MHISARYDLFYNLWSSVLNVENQEKKSFLGNALWRRLIYAQVLCQMKGIVELYNSYVFKSYITLQCISFGTFHLAVMVIIFKLFWVVFLGIPPQMSSSLYKSFTSDAIKSSKNKWISGSKNFSVYTLMKIHNRRKFHQYSICDC